MTRSPDCFAFSGERLRPHACNDGWVTIGQIALDPETGEEVERKEELPCRRCAEEASR